MRQSEKIKYMLTSQLTENELKNVIHYSFSNRPIDTNIWSELLDKLELTDEDITTRCQDKIKKLVYDAFIIKRIDYDEVSHNLSLLRAKKYIDKYTECRDIADLMKGWLLYTSTDKCYFYPNAWKEPEQNRILDFFNITPNKETYRSDDLTLMFCVYAVSTEYKRKISDYKRFEACAKLLANRLIELKEIYEVVRNYLIKLTSNLYYTPISQSTYNLIEETNQKIYYYIYNVTNGSVTTKLTAITDYCNCNKISLSFKYDVKENYIIQNTGFDFIFELLYYDILYFNSYGTFFNCLYA